MEKAAIVLVVIAASFVPMVLALLGWRAEEDKARARRLAEARMNARLLRLNI
jgi:hypothetical protein